MLLHAKLCVLACCVPGHCFFTHFPTEAWQTYLRSRNLKHIFVATWSVRGLWDARLFDSFRPVTGYAEWQVADTFEDADAQLVADTSDKSHLYGEDAPDECPVPGGELNEDVTTRGVSAGGSGSVSTDARKAAEDKSLAIAEGWNQAAIITRYHKFMRLLELLGPVGCGLTKEMLDDWVRPTYGLAGYSGGHVLSMQPKKFTAHGIVITLVPKAACRVWTAVDQHALYKHQWANRSIVSDLNSHASVDITASTYAKTAAGIKRLKTGRPEELLAAARKVSIAHQNLNISDFSSLKAVNDLVFQLGARRRNAASAFFVEHQNICEYMEFEETPPEVSFDDPEVLRYERLLKAEVMQLKEGELRKQLKLAIDDLSQWPTVAARDEALMEVQKLSTRKKHDVSPENKELLHLLKCELAFGFGKKYWLEWQAELARVDALEDAVQRNHELHALMKHWHTLNGSDSKHRKLFCFISELTIEFEACGGDPDALYHFTFNDALKKTRSEDVYKLSRSPQAFVIATSAAMIMGWASLLDTTQLPLVPSDAAVFPKLQAVAKMLGRRIPQGSQCTIKSVHELMKAVRPRSAVSCALAPPPPPAVRDET